MHSCAASIYTHWEADSTALPGVTADFDHASTKGEHSTEVLSAVIIIIIIRRI